MHWRAIRTILAGLIVHSLVSPAAAHAYLDAGTGSLIVQALLAGVVGVATVAKLYWSRIRALWSRGERSKPVGSSDGRQA